MKTLEKLMNRCPSYCTWGNERLANKTGLALSTVRRFKRSETYSQINRDYRNSL